MLARLFAERRLRVGFWLCAALATGIAFLLESAAFCTGGARACRVRRRSTLRSSARELGTRAA
jgi:hypothetical protein